MNKTHHGKRKYNTDDMKYMYYYMSTIIWAFSKLFSYSVYHVNIFAYIWD